MNRISVLALFLLSTTALNAQMMTPELLWSLERVSALGISKDKTAMVCRSSTYDIGNNNGSSTYFLQPLDGSEAKPVESIEGLLADDKRSEDGKMLLVSKEVKIKKMTGQDYYPYFPQSDAYIFDALNYRHWDKWEDGAYGHVFVQYEDGKEVDLMEGEAYDCPQQPFGGPEDYIWGPEYKKVYYVTKKEFGTAYATSTNTDIYEYTLKNGKTRNLTEANKGYDTSPAFSSKGQLAYLQMQEAGYEADKNDIILYDEGNSVNITKDWDGTVSSFLWSADGMSIYFNAAVMGTKQLFEVSLDGKIRQITKGQFDVRSLVEQNGTDMFITRTDMNHAAEVYKVDLTSGEMTQFTHVNDTIYNNLKMGNIESRMIPTTDGKEMLTWVIYPPDFDPAKKYPTLLYCQGGPQSPLSQFYSFRWNFQLMAANGYIIVAPNRRGMPGYGVEWNEQISGDWGGQNMKDYLAAIDALAKEDYVDEDRLGCIGASYGGYSAFYLAGIHEGRFKTFIAHDGIFNTRSMYGTTEELFFVNKDMGGSYWDPKAAKSYAQFNPIEHVEKWTAPILIIQGGKDFRVPIGQALEAFQAAQLRGIQSRLLYLPEENHWVLSPQNGLIWQKEFYRWLSETL